MTGITSKCVYGIIVILEFARKYNEDLLQIKDIARINKIPKSYLIQVLNKLKNSKIIESYRGNSGGYKLARNPAKITLLEVIEKLEGELTFFKTYVQNDVVKILFKKTEDEIKNNLNISILDLLVEQEKIDKKNMYYI